MKKLVYLLFLFLFIGSSFTNYQPLENFIQTLSLEVKIEQPRSSTSSDGALHLMVSGGKAPYTIQVVSTFNPSQVYQKEKVELKKLGAGNYIITVQDAEKHVLQKTIELTPVQ